MISRVVVLLILGSFLFAERTLLRIHVSGRDASGLAGTRTQIGKVAVFR